MKKMHKKTLQNHYFSRQERQDEQPKIVTYLDTLYEELNYWQYFSHKNICKLYLIIDDDADPFIYLIMQYCDLGDLMNWDEK